MNLRSINLDFKPLPNDEVKRFAWNTPELWKSFKSFRRKPAEDVLFNHVSSYDAFLLYHAARPLDVARYYEVGLEVADAKRMNARAREIFLSAEFPTISSGLLERAISDASTIHDKTLFAVIDEREVSGHYLIYGSEHICGIAAKLSREAGFDCRQILKNFGIPTLFRVSLPREMIPGRQLRNLSSYLLESVWDRRRLEHSPPLDWSFDLKCSIPSNCIVDHVHPERIPDPLQLNYPYTYKDNFPCFY